jgi:replicative DNA helicase
MRDKLALGDLELDIFKISQQDKSFLIKMMTHLSEDFFESTMHVKLFNCYKKFFNLYNKAPTEKMLRLYLTQNKESEDGIDLVCTRIFNTAIAPSQEKDMILDDVISRSKKRKIRDAIVEGSVLLSEKTDLDDSDMEQIVNKLRDAVKFSIDTNLGYDLYDIDARYNSMLADTSEKIPTGYGQINSILNGGWSKKEIACILGAPGFGKSIFLCNFGFHALKNGFNVVHYSMEMSETRVGARYDSIVSNISDKQLLENRDEVKDAYETLKKVTSKHLKIKEFPTSMASIFDLEAHLEELYLHEEFTPDLVIVDYGDIMRSSHKTNNNYEEQGWVFRELRGLAVKRNVALITASQATRDSLKSDGGTAENIGMDKMADSMEKNRILDYLFSIIQTKREKDDQIINLWTAKNRNGDSSKTLQFKINYHNYRITEALVGMKPDDAD